MADRPWAGGIVSDAAVSRGTAVSVDLARRLRARVEDAVSRPTFGEAQRELSRSSAG
jgi:hypothetical protein